MPGRSQSLKSAATAGLVGLAVIVGTWARLTPRSPLWLDEALTVNIARSSGGDLVDALVRDGHPPLYYWLLHHWMEWFGSGDLAVRSLSTVFGLVTIPLVALLAHRLAGRTGALAATVLVALSPYAIRYSSETRMYALVMLLATAGALLLDDLWRHPTRFRAVGLAVTVGALLWTHYWGLYLVVLVGLLIIVRGWRRPDDRRSATWAAASLIAGGLLFLPWLPSLLEQAEHTGTPWAIPPRPTQVVAATLGDLGGGGFSEALVAGALVSILLVVAFLPIVGVGPPGRVAVGSPRQGGLLSAELLVLTIIGTLAIGWVVAQLTEGAYAPRYAAVIVPFIIVLAAIGALRVQPRPLQVALAVGLVGLHAVAGVHNLGELRTQAGRHAASLAAGATREDLVVVCPDQLAPDLQRALLDRGLRQELFVYPDGGDPAVVDWREYETRNADNNPVAVAAALLAAQPARTIWVVWQGGYRTLLEQCESLVESLAAGRTATIVERNTDAFEPSSLWRLDP